jgi:hypothetical protein
MAKRRGYMTVDVDLGEAVDQMTDEMLLEEVKDRKLSLGRDDFDPIDDLHEIYNELLRGRPAEAMVILDRLLRPKWSNAKACEIAMLSRHRQEAKS